MRSTFHFEERQPRDEGDREPIGRPPTRDEGYGNSGQHDGHYEMQYSPPGKSSNRGHSGYPQYSQYPPHSLTPRHLQSVVTNSFSVEDERDDHGRGSGARRAMGEMRLSSIDRRNDVAEREDGGPADREDHYYRSQDYQMQGNMAPAPRASPAERTQVYLQRSFSTGSSSKFKTQQEPLKRSFYHHSRPTDAQPLHLPPEFMPPKRAKVNVSPRGDMVMTPRSPTGSVDNMRPYQWFDRTSWESDDEPYRVGRAQSFPPQGWAKQGPSPMNSFREGERPPKDLPHISPGSDAEPSPRSWHGPSQPEWGSPRNGGSSMPAPRFWNGRPDEDEHPMYSWDERNSMQHGIMRDGSRDSLVFQRRPYLHRMEDKMQLVVDAAAASGSDLGLNERYPSKDESLTLLALPQDKVALSETLCVVRENIEVFTATQADVDAPAPGRKHAVVVGQVGLRCIHCRHTTKCSDRVKRAVCYPSSIKRIYRTVIDMKLDHFSQCRFVPDGLKSRLRQLKAVQTRSTGTTMQYFIRAANALGMEDGPSGVRLKEGPMKSFASVDLTAPLPKKQCTTPMGTVIIQRSDSSGGSTSLDTHSHEHESKRTDSMMSTESFDSVGISEQIVSLDKYYEGQVPLALPEDASSLSPLRCFLRQQVCAFSATEEDIAVRAPTTFSITVGQVGIGCIHCVKQPAKLRSNRAVCFPFSIGRIYQSVADIQRFHFTECKMLPPDVKDKFLELQSASSKGSKGLATRQYWVTSARKIGLVDTKQGIRFGRDPNKPEESKAFSLDILAEAAFSVTTANKHLVVPEDKDTIAEFLYIVMEQLQPCRFTEADRNKRRLKDVGCIGVECKHCAGQVDGRKFFWSSVNAVESNFVSVHTHVLECRMIPDSLKAKIADLKMLRKQQTAALKTGSQKAFFSRVWNRLHQEEAAQQAAAAAAEGQDLIDDDEAMPPPLSQPPSPKLEQLSAVVAQESMLLLPQLPEVEESPSTNEAMSKDNDILTTSPSNDEDTPMEAV